MRIHAIHRSPLPLVPAHAREISYPRLFAHGPVANADKDAANFGIPTTRGGRTR
jgi:hypothetical protein